MENLPSCSYCLDPVGTNHNQPWRWNWQSDICENDLQSTWVVNIEMEESECIIIESNDGLGGFWFNGEVVGFNFRITGITIEDDATFGGSAEEAGFTVMSTMLSDYNANFLGIDLQDLSAIPPGEGILTQILLTDSMDEICIPLLMETMYPHPEISDNEANAIQVSVGDCYTPPECDLGDVNCDGTLNVLDIVLAANMILADEYDDIADVNQDGALDILDLVIMVNLVLYGDDGACIDIDENVYATVQIGEQVWMAENLKVTRYNDGDEIPTGYSDEEWTQLETGAYAVYPTDNDEASQSTCGDDCADVYGNLYNWYAVDDNRGVCPDGWHVPSDEEFMELEMYLGMSESEANSMNYRGTDEGSKLAGNSDLWNYGNLENNSEFGTSGFIGLPAGFRYFYDGSYRNMGYAGYFWSSSENNDYDIDFLNLAWFRMLNYNHPSVYRYSTDKKFGFSIRCVAD